MQKSTIRLILILFLILFFRNFVYAASAITDFTYKTKINYAADSLISGDVTGFPIAVHINTTSWSTASARQAFALSGTTGKRVQFFDYLGTTNLSYEVEYYTHSGSPDEVTEAVYWVKVPTIYNGSDTNNYIWVAYGNDPNGSDQDNPTGVWDSNYVAVYHLGDNCWGSSPEAKDSTSNGNHGTNSGATANQTGYVRNCPSFNGSSNKITLPSGAGIDNDSDGYTVSTWVNASTVSAGRYIWIDQYDGNNQKVLYFAGSPVKFYFYGYWDSSYQYSIVSNSTPSTSTWYYVYGTAKTNEANFYINNAQQGSTDTSVTAKSYTHSTENIGGSPYGYHSGYIDELRISNIARSADWRTLEYYSTKKTSWNGDEWITVGSQQCTVYTVIPFVGNGSGSISPNTVQCVGSGTVEFTLTASVGYEILSVGGTCGGSLDGTTFTTNTITADCTVIANFMASNYLTPSSSIPTINGKEDLRYYSKHFDTSYYPTSYVDSRVSRCYLFKHSTDEYNDYTETTDKYLLPALGNEAGDAVYFRGNFIPSYLKITMSTAGVGSWGITWKYWNGLSWVAFSNVVDGTADSGVSFKQSGNVTWDTPTDWEPNEVNYITGYWVKAEVTSFTSMSTQPNASAVYLGGRIQTTPYKAWTNLYNDEPSCLVRGGTWDGNFTHYIEVELSAMTQDAKVAIWQLSNSVNGFLDTRLSPDALILYLSQESGSYILRMKERYGSVNATEETYTLDDSMRRRVFYVKLVRDETVGSYGTLTAYLYYDRNYTNLITSKTLTLHKKSDFSYFYAINSYYGTTADKYSVISVGNIYLYSQPKVFLNSIQTTIPFQGQIDDSFSDYPTGWTTSIPSGTTNEKVSSASVKASDTYSVHMVAKSDGTDTSAYQVVGSDVGRQAATASAWVKINSIDDGKKAFLFGMVSSSGKNVGVYIYRSGANYYWRLYYDGSWGSQTRYTLETGKWYYVVLLYSDLVHNGTFRDLMLWVTDENEVTGNYHGTCVSSVTTTASQTFNQGYIGNLLSSDSSYANSDRHIDEFKFINGFPLFPGLARGGISKTTLVMTQRIGQKHAWESSPPSGIVRIQVMKSLDDGVHWTYVTQFSNPTNYEYRQAKVVWDSVNSLWWFFVQMADNTLTERTKVYYANSDLSTVTAISADNYDLTGLFYPSREMDGYDILGGSEYFTSPDDSTRYSTFDRFNTSLMIKTGTVTVASYQDGPSYLAAERIYNEPFVYRSSINNNLYMILSFPYVPTHQRILVSSDNGSTWIPDRSITANAGGIWSGLDMYYKSANVYAFPFAGYLWLQYRNDRFNDTNGFYASGIAKLRTDSFLWMDVQEYGWLDSNYIGAEFGNGCIDAKPSRRSGNLLLDTAYDVGLSWYKLIQTDVSASIPRHGFTNFQDPGIN